MNDEEWRRLDNLPYLVSDRGRVRHALFDRILKPRVSASGHHGVLLSKDGVSKHYAIHRLVLTAFDRPAEPGEVCRHLDGNPANNHVSNLTWGTQTENQRDRKTHGTDPSGERNPNAKLTAAQARAIFVDPRAQTEIAAEYGVTQPLVGMIKRGEAWGEETSGLKPGRKNAAALTDETKAQILELRDHGLSGRKIASQLGLKRGQVFGFLSAQR